ncbi:M20 family metallopeptidase [Salinicola rhizosphaerae]|uniref:Acetylornithine deacetylase n=1 Tax=Salinicola rhizosphaerae TaxID=1443141 RepID=A0ABQ3DZU5_9GAMM|nr:M20 family metallopeptidase [Salinicola rhizosphaerae]GHB14589.1 acetylornithine deacetylase [Salinicola rhizosphaerae]
MTSSSDTTIDLLRRLVAIDTQNPGSPELPAIELLADALRQSGFAVDIDEFLPGRANVTARLENGPGPTLAFNTHVDVVPHGEGWTDSPLSLTERDGRLYGRGACDAKGQAAVMVEAMRRLAADRETWSGTLMGVFVADEEVGSAGARHFAATTAPGSIDYAIIGEPTGNRPVIAHKGSLRPIVRVRGKTAHSGTPDLGINAIYQAAKLIDHVERTHPEIRQRTHPLVGNASLTITRIHGGHADNVVPEGCDIMLDRRLIPGETDAGVKHELAEIVTRAGEALGFEAEIVEYKPTTGGAAETPADHLIVRTALAVCSEAVGETIEAGGFQGGCDMVHFAGLGTDCVVIGPGSLAVAHQPDEFVPIDELLQAVDIHREMVRRLLPRQA